MPIFDYKCLKCGKVNEIFQRTTDEKIVSCPDCGSPDMKKQFSAPGLVKMDDSSAPEQHVAVGKRDVQLPPVQPMEIAEETVNMRESGNNISKGGYQG